MSRIYFYRQDEGYDTDEMRNRISVGDVRDREVSAVEALLERPDISSGDLDRGPESLFSSLSNKLDTYEYNRFIKQVFNAKGEKGDIFNLQFYLSEDVEYDSIYQTADSKVQNDDHEDLILQPISKSLVSVNKRGKGRVDFRFVVGRRQRRGTGGSGGETLGYAEARVYTEEQVVAISNRDMDDEAKQSIRSTLNTWTDGTIFSKTDFGENELLALQNSLDGQNCGIDYGNFNDNNINTAKYRGDRGMSLSTSRVVQPASDGGRIVTLRFYVDYLNNGQNREILIRLHSDGHTTSSKETQPEYIDNLVSNIRLVEQISEFLRPVSNQLGKYKRKLSIKGIINNYPAYRQRKILALESTVREFVPQDQRQPVERQMFMAIVLNVAIELIKLDQSGSLSTGTISNYPTEEEKLRGLLEDYATHVIQDPHFNFETVWFHLHSLLTSSYSSPVELVETARSQYGI